MIRILRKAKVQLFRYFLQFRSTEHVFMVAMAILIGLLAGFGAVGIQWLIRFFQTTLWGAEEFPPDHLLTVPVHLKIIIPVLGSAAVGAMVYYFAREAKGHGVPEVMQAIALRNGVIRPRVALVKLLASSLYIGSGGSVGREGPVIQIGAGIGSTLGQLFRVNPQRLKTFVACGASAGIAAAFNAPIGGALFSVEVILGDFAVSQFSPIVIAAVVATVVSRGMVGDFPAFQVPHYELVSPVELVFYAGLGLLAGLVALLYIRVLYAFEDFFEELKIHEVLKTMIGGLLLGGIGVFVPQIFGVGYHATNDVLHGATHSPFGPDLLWLFLLLLVLVKILATSISLGSGGSGGVFAPSLFIGAMTGGFFGEIVHAQFPTVTAHSGAYALVGMAALVGSSTHAPITAILIIFEMTNDYKIILPLMICVVIATLLTTKLQKESIYTLKLIRRGIDLFRGREANILRSLKVRDIMRDDPVRIPAGTTFPEIIHLFFASSFGQVYVVDRDERLLGVITLADVRRIMQERDYLGGIVIAHDLMTPLSAHVFPDDSLDQVMRIFGRNAVEELPVLSPEDAERVAGFVSYRDVIEAYNRELMRRDLVSETGASIKLVQQTRKITFMDGYALAEVPAPMGFDGKTVRELDLRNRFGVNVLMVKRRDAEGVERERVPQPEDVIHHGDLLIVMGKEKDLERFRHG